MSNNTMPERISAYIGGSGLGCFEMHPRVPLTTEYIRADVAQAQIDAERNRIVDAINAIVRMNLSSDVHLYAQAIKAAVWNDEDDPREILAREIRHMESKR